VGSAAEEIDEKTEMRSYDLVALRIWSGSNHSKRIDSPEVARGERRSPLRLQSELRGQGREE
jgi:hypothetical protein